MKVFALCALLFGLTEALKIKDKLHADICPAMKEVILTNKFKYLWRDNDVVENVKFIAPPGLDRAIMISGKNITLKNVIVHHSASGIGIYTWKAHGLKMDNVEVKSYGNSNGPNPCAMVRPIFGYDCANIKINKSERVVLKNIRVEGGSIGINSVLSPGIDISFVDVKNVRGPYPRG